MDFDKIKREKADKKRVPTSISLPAYLQKRLDFAAAKAGVSRSKIIEQLVEEYLT